MAYINGDTSCCGLREIADLHSGASPEDNLKRLVKQMYANIKPKPKTPPADLQAKIDAYMKENGPPDGKWIDKGYGDPYFVGRNGLYIYKIDLEDKARSLFDPTYLSYDDDYDDYRSGTDDHYWRYAVFTQAGSGASYGKDFAAYLTEHKLGEVVQATTKTVKNPNSGNILKAWLWTVNHRNLRNWAKKHL